jgi:DNA-binding phage protein
MMTPEDPRHGTHAGALAHRRDGSSMCLPCRTAVRRYVKAAKVRLNNGVRNRVPLGQRAWKILNNVGCTPVAEKTGLWRNNLYRARRRGPDALVLRSTRDAILRAAGPTPIGVQRRVRALTALGHTIEAIAAAAGVHREGLGRMSRSPQPTTMMRPHMVAGVVAAYELLRDAPAPDDRYAARRRSTSKARGWLPPDVWDDIDDPHEDPLAEPDPDYLDPILVERIIAGDFALLAFVPDGDTARREVCRAWWQSGRSLADLGRRTGWQPNRYFKVREQVSA